MRLGWIGAIFSLLAACASADDPGRAQSGAVGSCIPNKTSPCLCGLETGSQTCKDDGTYTVCDCKTEASPSPPETTPPPTAPTATCGNGKVDTDESCDDGNAISGDGCSASCEPDGTPAEASACPGQAVTVWPGKTTTLSGTTGGFEDHFTSSCAASTGADRRYVIEPSTDGNLTISASFAAGYNAVVELREGACVNGTSLLCEDTFSAPFSRVAAVLAHHTYFLLVDGFSTGDEGAFVIQLGLAR